MEVKVSAAMMRQLFTPCSPEFIATVCHASCCRSTTDPTGIAVTVTGPEEADRIRGYGARVEGLRIVPVARVCPFQQVDHLCALHDGRQPFGCTASPFTLNAKNTLVVRNRYRMLKCYRGPGALPAYRAHPAALAAILGTEQAAELTAHLDAGGGDLMLTIPDHVGEWLHAKNANSRTSDAEGT